MKIYISSLLLAIKIFLRFDEINAVGGQEASSSSKRARNDTPDLIKVEKNAQDGRPHETVFIGTQAIEVWLDQSRSHVVKAWYKDCQIPTERYFEKNDCLIRLFIDKRLKLRLVAYIDKYNVLIGVRAPQPPGEPKSELEPSSIIFYVIHAGRTFELYYNTFIEKVTVLQLKPKGIYRNFAEKVPVVVAGLHFTVYRVNSMSGKKIIGGKLDQILPEENPGQTLNEPLQRGHVKTEPGQSVRVKTEPGQSGRVKTEPGQSVHVKTEPGPSVHVKTEHVSSVRVKTEPWN